MMIAIIKIMQLKDSEHVIDAPYIHRTNVFHVLSIKSRSFIICLLLLTNRDIYRESGSSLK